MRKFSTLIVAVSLLCVLSLCTSLSAIPVTGDLQVHLDANTISGLTDGDPVTGWTDQSGNGRNLTTVTGTAPQYQSTAMNGMPVVRFDGTGSLGSAAFGTNIDMSTSDMTAFVVFQTTVPPTQRTFYSFDSTATNNQVFSYVNRYVTGALLTTYDATSGDDALNELTDQLYNNGAPHVYSTTTDGSLNTAYGDSGAGSSYTDAGATNDLDQLWVGSLSGGVSARLLGDVAEIVVYNRELNIAERLISENHLAAKYSGTGSTLLVGNDLYEGDDNGKGNYDFNVIGIGQQAGESLTATPVGEGAGLQISEANSSLDDLDYLIAGTDGSAHGLTPAEDLVGDRWTRTYYLDKTGEVDATLTFDLSGSGAEGLPLFENTYSLLYSSSNSPFSWQSIAETSPVGNEVQFTLNSAQLLDGYYTLGVQVVPEPSTGLLLLIALPALAHRRRRNRVSK